MDKLRILIVDDEPLARLRLAQLVADVDAAGEVAASVAGACGGAEEALAWLGAQAADLLLLDIQMPGLDGLGLAGRLREAGQAPAIVFVTAHAEHALQAFELEADDYLTKPVRRERLQAALARVVRRRDTAAPLAAPASDSAAVIVVSERGRVVRVPLHAVLYLKAELKYVTLRTAERHYLLDDSLTDLEQRLGERFLRVHRNAIVARGAVGALETRVLDEEGGEGWAVRVEPTGEWLAVSRRQVAAVREALEASGL